jgi:hypothetical protein
MRSRLWFLAKPPSCRFRTVSKKMMCCGASSVMPRSWAAVSYIAAAIAEPGVIARNGTMQRLVFGEYDGSRSTRSEAFLDACRRAKIDAELSGDIRRAIWEKFVFLVGLSGTTATMRLPIGPIGTSARRGASSANRRADRRHLVRRRCPAQGRADLHIAPTAAGRLICRQREERFPVRLH